MTPEQKIAHLSGLCARLVSLVCAADAMLPTDQNGATALLNEAMMHSRDIRELRAPDGREKGVLPNLAIVEGGVSEPQGAGATPFDANLIISLIGRINERLVAIEARMGSNGGPPLFDPPPPPNLPATA